MKKIAKILIPALIILVVMLIPLPADDLYLGFHIKEGSRDDYRLYYSTVGSPGFSGDLYIDSYYDEGKKMVMFRLDPSLEGEVTGLRLDLPPADEKVVIDGVCVNSGGLVKKRFSVPDIFNEGNYLIVNGMQLQTVDARETVVALTTESDPYVVFGPSATESLASGFSHKLLTRSVIALMIAAGMLFYNRDYFGTLSSKGNAE